jgi:hypothetical protein
MRAILQLRRTKQCCRVLSKKSRRELLVASFIQADPHQVPMVRHQDVAWASEMVACASVQENLAKA